MVEQDDAVASRSAIDWPSDFTVNLRGFLRFLGALRSLRHCAANTRRLTIIGT